jgi:hypothetical protein
VERAVELRLFREHHDGPLCYKSDNRQTNSASSLEMLLRRLANRSPSTAFAGRATGRATNHFSASWPGRLGACRWRFRRRAYRPR